MPPEVRDTFPGSRGTAAGYEALRRNAAWGDPGPRAAIMVRGPDAVRFVDGFTTAAVSRLTVGAGTEGFFPDARGWVIALANLFRLEDGLWIDAAGELAARLIEHLEHYHIRERLEMVDESSSRSTLVVAGPMAAAWLAERLDSSLPEHHLGHAPGRLGDVAVTVARTDRYGPVDFLVQSAVDDRSRLEAWFEGQGLPRATREALEAARIEVGTPEPVDIPEKTLPQELGRDAQAIAFDKGCYLGQETVARIDALGHVNRRLAAVAVADLREHRAGVEVTLDGEVVGRLTSLCFAPAVGRIVGLGLVHSKALVGGRAIVVDGEAAEILPLPIAPSTSSSVATAGGPHGVRDESQPGTLLLATRRFDVVRVAEACTDGSHREREVVRHPGSVVVVPMVSAGAVCLVEVVRVAVGLTLLELPAGTLDRVESLEEAARRELAEETGYRAGTMDAVGAFWMSPGILRERMHLFVAEKLVPGPQALEPGEQIRTRVVSWDDAVAMCLDGRIDDAKTVAGILLVDARRRR